ncbi:MAG: transposase [Polyangiaceae bacterium]|nr:transposase [Polyangiaceae bacterium]
MKAVIGSKPERPRRLPKSRDLYAMRYLVERFFHELKRFRAIATRYEKTACSYLALVHLACARPGSRHRQEWRRRCRALSGRPACEHGGQPPQQAEQLCDLALCRKPQPPERLHTGSGFTGLSARHAAVARDLLAARSPSASCRNADWLALRS